jgi:hypothetical protein
MYKSHIHLQAPKSGLLLPLLGAGFALLAVIAIAVGAAPLAGWLQASYHEASGGTSATDQRTEDSTATSTGGDTRSKGRCKFCGIIESIRQVGGVHEVTVRLSDQTTRVLSDSNPANWRPGERIILIGGGNSPRR